MLIGCVSCGGTRLASRRLGAARGSLVVPLGTLAGRFYNGPLSRAHTLGTALSAPQDKRPHFSTAMYIEWRPRGRHSKTSVSRRAPLTCHGAGPLGRCTCLSGYLCLYFRLVNTLIQITCPDGALLSLASDFPRLVRGLSTDSQLLPVTASYCVLLLPQWTDPHGGRGLACGQITLG